MELITRACYCSRDDLISALDLYETGNSHTNAQLDRAIQDASDAIDGAMHRKFYPEDATRYFDWPNWQYAQPWRIYYDQYDLVSATSVLTGTTNIPLGNLFFEPANKEANEPYTYMEINRSTNSAYGFSSTPQHDVSVTGTWGYTAQTAPAGTLAASILAADLTMTISDGTQLGVGDLAVIGSERILVQDKKFTDTSVSYTGLSTAVNSDNVAGVADGTKFAVGEMLRVDSEQLLITDIQGNNLIVKRAWGGTVLATHSSGTLYAARLLTVSRGMYGTTAADASQDASVSRHVPPSGIRNLCIAEALNSVLGETSGYGRTVGEGDNAMAATGSGLAGKWAQAIRRYARKARTGAILWLLPVSTLMFPGRCLTVRLTRLSRIGWIKLRRKSLTRVSVNWTL